MGTHQQTKTFGTSISTAASRKHANMPPSTRPGTCRLIDFQPHNFYTHLASNRTLPSLLACPTALSTWHTTLHTLPWTLLYPTLLWHECVICLSVFPRPQISPAWQSTQPNDLRTRAPVSRSLMMPLLNHCHMVSLRLTWLRFIYHQHPITMHLRRNLTCANLTSLDIGLLEWLFYPRITG